MAAINPCTIMLCYFYTSFLFVNLFEICAHWISVINYYYYFEYIVWNSWHFATTFHGTSSKSSGRPWQTKENNNKLTPVRSSHAPLFTSVLWGACLMSVSGVNRLAQWHQRIFSLVKITPSQVCGPMCCFHWLKPFMPDWLFTCPDSLWI